MNWWKKLDPNARRLLMVGVPLAALAALVAAMRKKDEPVTDEAAAAAGGAGTLPPPMGGWILGGSTEAAGVGELGSIIGDLGGLIAGIPQQILDQINQDRPTPPPTTPPPATPGVPVNKQPKYHQTASGQTLGDIAYVVYRNYAGGKAQGWARIRADNADIANRYGLNGKLPAGLRIVLRAPAEGWKS